MNRQGTMCCAWEKTAFEEGLKALNNSYPLVRPRIYVRVYE
ncbi:hypothetical protein [Blautia sp. AF32-4BH]|nr:hypothetical protein [Blautia sp. AF32-4BH]